MTEATDYRPMWAELGLDLEKHDALLGVLGRVYSDIYMAQKNRPDGMGYFDFVMSEVHGLRIQELLDARADGVIHYALQFCSPYQIEAPLLEHHLKDGGLPVLRIDTDYGQDDAGQLRTRVEAFIEQIKR